LDHATVSDDRPLCVDLDGTLLATDSLYELAVRLLRTHPRTALQLPGWLRAGRAALKRRITERVCLDPRLLPYHSEVVAWLREEARRGREVVLVTAADRAVAEPIAEHIGVFSEVMASDGAENLKGSRKASALVERFGAGGFEYLGDAHADLPVWAAAGGASLVAPSQRLRGRASAQGPVLRELEGRAGPAARLASWAALLGVKRWPLNGLVWVPSLFGGGTVALAPLVAAFVALCALGSGLEILRQLRDLDRDRADGVGGRALATGDVSLLAGGFAAGVCLLVVAGLVAWLPWTFAAVLAAETPRQWGAWASWARGRPARSSLVLAGVALRLLGGHLLR